MINVSAEAAKKVASLMNEEGKDLAASYVRVGVKSGGCSGLSYDMGIVDGPLTAFDRDIHSLALHMGAARQAGQPVTTGEIAIKTQGKAAAVVLKRRHLRQR